HADDDPALWRQGGNVAHVPLVLAVAVRFAAISITIGVALGVFVLGEVVPIGTPRERRTGSLLPLVENALDLLAQRACQIAAGLPPLPPPLPHPLHQLLPLPP